ncbi:hypothetical protein GCM10022237_46280 [Nocardioides ginsengisoli]|uniref:PIN domain-containing protein n=1 Tax=Nocardioides ginsengisoli TaxID=363868 RepID=A0ABW3W7T5_9ACTN
MDRRHFVWPTSGTGGDLASTLRDAGLAAANSNNGNGPEIIDKYLTWGSEQSRMLRGRISSEDLSRLVTTPRYWATVSAPEATPPTVRAITDELSHRSQVLAAAAEAVRAAADAWRPKDGTFTSLALVDTSFWIEHEGNFGSIDWHDLITSVPSPGAPSVGDELRIVVPVLVIDELDDLTHKASLRPKAVGVARYLYGLLRGHTTAPITIAPEQGGRGAVTMQLLFDPHDHRRLPINDAEMIERTISVRDFIGIPEKQAFFLTYDTGAAFRAEHAGLMPRLIPRRATR